MRRRRRWCVWNGIFALLIIFLFARLDIVEKKVDGALFPGRDTYLNWAGGRYEILDPNSSGYYSLYRWQSQEGEPIPTCLSDNVIRFYVSDEHSYIEAIEGYMVIDHSTHDFPFFVEFGDLALQYQSVFNDSHLFSR